MTVDLSKVRPGDEVTVRFKVKTAKTNDYRGLPYVVCDDPLEDPAEGPRELRDVAVLWTRIVSHTPKALAVGDRVRDGAHPTATKATVLFADDRDVVIRTDEGGIHSGPVDGDWVKRLERAHD